MEFLPDPPKATTGVEIRVLTLEEVKPLLESLGQNLPAIPNLAGYVGEVVDGRIVSFIQIDLRPHVAMWVEPGHGASIPRLVKAAESQILSVLGPQHVYCMTPKGRVGKLAEVMGMHKQPWETYTKLVVSEIPKLPVVEFLPEGEKSVIITPETPNEEDEDVVRTQ